MSMAMNMGLGLGVIVGFGALALDLGYANFARTQAQAAADSAAIAGAISLQLDSNNDAGMVADAQTWGQRNDVGSVDVVVDAVDVRRGNHEIGDDCADFVDNATGMDVIARAHTTAATSFLSRIWGVANLNSQACAVARVIPPTTCTMIGLGDAGVNGNSNLLVGYDSTVDPDPANSPNEEAAVCSNSDITLNGGPTVEGGVRPGIGAEIDGNSDNVTGSTDPLGEVLDFPAPDFAEIALDYPDGKEPWPLAYNINNSVVLGAGAYELTNDLRISGQGKITLLGDGPVAILTNGNKLTLTGNGIIFPVGADTHDFSIYAQGDAEIKVGGTSAFYGFVYAPAAPVTLNGDAAFYGAVVSDGLTINGGGTNPIYMDISLMEEKQDGGIQLIR